MRPQTSSTAGVLAFTNAQRPKVENVRPEPFAGQPGFAFDFSFTSKNELAGEGFERGTIRNDKLYLVAYHGTRLRYFDMYSKDAEAVIGSVPPSGQDEQGVARHPRYERRWPEVPRVWQLPTQHVDDAAAGNHGEYPVQHRVR